MSTDRQETYGATHNEGQSHGCDQGNGPETFGTTYNEPGRSHHGQEARGATTWNNSSFSGNGASLQPNGGINVSGDAANIPSRHRDPSENYPQTYGVRDNQPSRHHPIDISVSNLNGKSSTVRADLEWTQDMLLREISREQGMNSGQLQASYLGKPLSGTGTLREAGLSNKCSVNVSGRLRGG